MFGWLNDPDHLRFADESLGQGGVAGVEGPELLERDVAAEVGLAGEVHHRHAAAPDLAHDLVAADDARSVAHRGDRLV